MQQKVLCFGELLLRLSPDAENRWSKQHSMPAFIGGAELNVASALARWAIPVSYFSALPDNFFTDQLLASVSDRGIDVSKVIRFGDRLGLYYLQSGADMKHDAVIYDRANSSFAMLTPEKVDWDMLLREVNWFHFSAICPALSPQAAHLCLAALKACSERGITVSVDLNYRSRLWQYGKTPDEIMPALLPYCQYVFGNLWAAEKMLSIPVPPKLAEIDSREAYLEQAMETSLQIMQRFPACRAVANSFRFDREGISYYGSLYDGQQLYVSAEYNARTVVDRVGSGDCFMAGFILGICQKWNMQEVIDFAAAAAFQKLFIPGDNTTLSPEAIKSTIREHA